MYSKTHLTPDGLRVPGFVEIRAEKRAPRTQATSETGPGRDMRPPEAQAKSAAQSSADLAAAREKTAAPQRSGETAGLILQAIELAGSEHPDLRLAAAALFLAAVAD